LSLFLSTAPPTTELYTLSLHDALPIWAWVRVRSSGVTGDPRGLESPTGSPTRPVSRKENWKKSRTLVGPRPRGRGTGTLNSAPRSEEHTSELQSRRDLVCRLLLEKKKK